MRTVCEQSVSKMLTKIRSKLGFLLLRYQIEIFKSRLSLIQG